MDLSTLITRTRSILDDTVGADADKLWNDADLTSYANRVERDICRLARPLVDGITTATCSISVTALANTNSYALSPLVIDIADRDARLVGKFYPLRKRSYREFQNTFINWDTTKGTPTGFCLDYQRGKITLNYIPDFDDTLKLRVVRLPLAELSTGANVPEIPLAYHDYMPEMMAYYAFGKQDAEAFNRSKRAEYYTICYDPRNANSHIERIKRMELQYSSRPQSAFGV